MIYQKDHHKMCNDRVEIALTLANYISCCYVIIDISSNS